MRTLALCFTLALTAACGGDDPATTDTAGGSSTTPPTTDVDAANLYASYCASCHGADGEGTSIASSTMEVYIGSDGVAEVSAQIQNGGGNMPPVTALTPEEADAVAAWVIAEFAAR